MFLFPGHPVSIFLKCWDILTQHKNDKQWGAIDVWDFLFKTCDSICNEIISFPVYPVLYHEGQQTRLSWSHGSTAIPGIL